MKKAHEKAVHQTPEAAFQAATPAFATRLAKLPGIKVGRTHPFTVHAQPITQEGTDEPAAYQVQVGYVAHGVNAQYTVSLAATGVYSWGVQSISHADLQTNGNSTGANQPFSAFNTWLESLDESVGQGKIMDAIRNAEFQPSTAVSASKARAEPR